MSRAAATTLVLVVVWEITIAPTPVFAQSMCRCECWYLANGRRVCRRVCARRPDPQPAFQAPALPSIASVTPSASSVSDALSPIFTALLFITGFVCVSRLVRLAREHSPPSLSLTGAPSPPPGGSPGWWRNRKLRKLAKSTAIVRANHDLITARLDEAQARRQFEQLLEELRPQPQPPPSAADRGPETPSLTLAEIQTTLAVLGPDISDEQRRRLLELLAATAQEKVEP